MSVSVTTVAKHEHRGAGCGPGWISGYLDDRDVDVLGINLAGLEIVAELRLPPQPPSQAPQIVVAARKP